MHSFVFQKTRDIEFETFARKNPRYNLWQSLQWKEFQNAIGRKTFLAGIKDKGQLIAGGLVIKHQLPWRKCWLEIPRGPLFSQEENKEFVQTQISCLMKVFHQLGQEENAIFCRINPYQFDLSASPGSRIVPELTESHPATTLVLDLTLSKEELLKQMKPKGRYNINLARKKGVKVFRSIDTDTYFQLLQETTKRDQFCGHAQNYYQKMLEAFQDKGFMLLAEYQGKIIAGGIFTLVGQRAIYYYGASGNQDRNVMAPYLVQWEAILEAKRQGCKIYDFLGIAPEGAENTHPLAKVTEFKRKFGGKIEKYPKGKDIIFSHWWYFLYRMKKKIF
jgi:lipid II:glycine glycyltransferase (peptidoglycan interpeptide bridge formation enzyme)